MADLNNMAPLQLFIYPQSCCLCHKQSASSSASILTVTLRKPKGNNHCVHWCKSSTRRRGLCKSANELLTNTRWSMEVGEWKLLTSVAAVTRSSICLLVICCHVTVTWLAFPACSVIHDNTKKIPKKATSEPYCHVSDAIQAKVSKKTWIDNMAIHA